MATTMDLPFDGRKVVRVTRAQVNAAQGRILADRKQNRLTPEWIVKVANAKSRRA